MKVIDLLNKIAKGEIYENCKMKFKEIEPEAVSEYVIYDRLYEEDLTLNDEVEIIEDEFIDIEKINNGYYHENQDRINEMFKNTINDLIENEKKMIERIKKNESN